LDHIPTARFRTSVPPCPFCKRPLKLCHLLTLQSSHSNSPQFSLTYNHLVFWSVARRTTSLHLPCAAPAVGLRVGSWEGDQLIFFFRSWIWIFRLVRGIVSGGRECLFQIQFDTFLNEINFYDPFLLKFLIVYVGSRFNLIQIQIVGFLWWWILRFEFSFAMVNWSTTRFAFSTDWDRQKKTWILFRFRGVCHCSLLHPATEQIPWYVNQYICWWWTDAAVNSAECILARGLFCINM
jgi:hypothetical protein